MNSVETVAEINWSIFANQFNRKQLGKRSKEKGKSISHSKLFEAETFGPDETRTYLINKCLN